ncbi:hypothetical protein SAMN05216499_1489 [Actinacidiphila paucisporea]|uniref:Uncharacterized protein n=1 Tax=Actinacidiphila paucisporea TaxID=310782 RepID=A0A1M7QY86_9ACTN|nr:hypothetical protein SAMN05216499_1489 [Actinacidiphila paucisporea]
MGKTAFAVRFVSGRRRCGFQPTVRRQGGLARRAQSPWVGDVGMAVESESGRTEPRPPQRAAYRSVGRGACGQKPGVGRGRLVVTGGHALLRAECSRV